MNDKFVNLSNHPAASWSQDQLAAAATFGKVVDVPFPAIDPAATTEDIVSLASSILNDLIGTYGAANLTVHVMGEMGFVFAFVSMANDKGVNCVASTTQRKVEYVGDKKISTFNFVQFRPYCGL